MILVWSSFYASVLPSLNWRGDGCMIWVEFVTTSKPLAPPQNVAVVYSYISFSRLVPRPSLVSILHSEKLGMPCRFYDVIVT